MRTAVAGGKVKLMMIADTVPVPYRCKPRAHGREPGIDFFDEGGVVVKMGAVPANRPGTTYL